MRQQQTTNFFTNFQAEDGELNKIKKNFTQFHFVMKSIE